jgi:hypothetical protein
MSAVDGNVVGPPHGAEREGNETHGFGYVRTAWPTTQAVKHATKTPLWMIFADMFESS